MKTVLIPKGETVCYESLETERLIVQGCVKVTYGIHAKSISGNGTVIAGTVEADDIRAHSIESASVICKRLLAANVHTPELIASDSAAVSTFLSSAYVKTGKLTVAVGEIDQVEANTVINTGTRQRSLLGLLIVSALRCLWARLAVKPIHGTDSDTTDTAGEPAAIPAAPTPPKQETPEPEAPEPEAVDEELNRIINLFKLTRESGYTLRIVPGTPEENAPVFDFDTGRILRAA